MVLGAVRFRDIGAWWKMEYLDLDLLDDDDERMLRKLVEIDRKRKAQVSGYLYTASRNDREGTIIRHLDQAKMLNVTYFEGDPSVLEVYAAGYSYIAKKDKELEDERRRVEERKQDMRHDWKITAFSALAGILGVVIGFVLGRI